MCVLIYECIYFNIILCTISSLHIYINTIYKYLWKLSTISRLSDWMRFNIFGRIIWKRISTRSQMSRQRPSGSGTSFSGSICVCVCQAREQSLSWVCVRDKVAHVENRSPSWGLISMPEHICRLLQGGLSNNKVMLKLKLACMLLWASSVQHHISLN